jgi:hypothetical protein
LGGINFGRVVLGGLAAGLVLNVFDFVLHGVVLKNDWDQALRALNKPPMEGSTVLVFVVLDFIIGIFMTWLYASMRPRYGPGPKTAAIAGLTVWFAYLIFNISEWPLDLWPARLVVISTVAGMFYAPLGAMAGGWLYREEAGS